MIWTRLCQLLERMADPYAPTPAPEASVAGFLRGGLHPLRGVLVLSLASTLAAGILEVWLIRLAGQVIDVLAGQAPDIVWQSLGWGALGLAAVLLVGRPVLHFMREGTNDLAFRPNAATLYRWRALTHVLRQPVGWFEDDFTGRTAQRVIEAGSSATSALYSLLNAVAYVSVYLVGVLLLFAATDPWLILPLLVWFAVYGWAFRVLIPRFARDNTAFHAARSALSGRLVDAFGNIGSLKLYASSAALEADLKGDVEAVRQRFFALQRTEVGINMITTVLEGAIMVALVGFAVALWASGQASLGIVAAALALVFKITSMMEWFLGAVDGVVEAVSALHEELQTVAQPLRVQDAPDAVPLVLSQGGIAIEGLTHHYGRGGGVLQDVSLTIAPGEKVGIVGPSGAGKSTLVHLLLRFHEAEAGRIAIDGQDIRSVTQDSLRAAIGMVAQAPSLLHRSVAGNIALGRPETPPAQIEAAARAAEAHGFIETLCDAQGRSGYATHVGERGVKLSGGQRQRIALARAILKDAPILILDEATSALDSEVEAAIQDTLDRLMMGKTVIAVAHRLSTIARMDRIVVMENGRIVEQGCHNSLLEAGGLYARLWARQSGGFLATEGKEASA